jgi:hypothetical protein
MTATAAVDMFVVATATFKLLYAHTSAQCRDVSIALRRAPARTASEVSWEAAIRAIFIGIVMLSASIAVVHTAEARYRTQNHPRARSVIGTQRVTTLRRKISSAKPVGLRRSTSKIGRSTVR